MKITYTENKNGIYYPNLTLSAGATYSIGKYGRLYLDYLKRHRRGTYSGSESKNRNQHLTREEKDLPKAARRWGRNAGEAY